jgi:hypothetical protein
LGIRCGCGRRKLGRRSVGAASLDDVASELGGRYDPALGSGLMFTARIFLRGGADQ